ncbi:MAG: FHA domain-containing protein [Terriglobales bacterium]
MFNTLPLMDLPIFAPLQSLSGDITIPDPHTKRRARLINMKGNVCVDCDSVMLIGRGERCEVKIDEAFASRLHAAVVSTKNGFYLFDLNSKNGTHVNGKRVDGSVQLKQADQILIGGTLIVFSLPS